MRNLNQFGKELAQVFFFLYGTADLGGEENKILSIVKTLKELLPWLDEQEKRIGDGSNHADRHQSDFRSNVVNLSSMAQNLKTKLINYRTEQLFAKALTQRNADQYKEAKSGILSLLTKKK